MHGGANAHDPAIHGGGVVMPRGCHLPARVDVDPAMVHGGLGGPDVDHGGLGYPAAHHGGVVPDKTAQPARSVV